jgi:hypothetical protein
MISSYLTVPFASVITGFEYGSHSAITVDSSLVGLAISVDASTTASSSVTITEPRAI